MTDRDEELIERVAARFAARFAEAVENDPELAAGMDAMLEVMTRRIRWLLVEEGEGADDEPLMAQGINRTL